ncbi:MAG: hypothetical protein IH808_14620, partial [Proteobacteria bacterium]|nr:hypothetical protein [Pseudomonadota bacterium]
MEPFKIEQALLLEFFTILLIVLAVVTLLGHGIWVVLAVIVDAIIGNNRSATRGRDCPNCGKRRAVVSGQCTKCGATPFIRPAAGVAPPDEMLITTRRLERLLARGAISREEFDKLDAL